MENLSFYKDFNTYFGELNVYLSKVENSSEVGEFLALVYLSSILIDFTILNLSLI